MNKKLITTIICLTCFALHCIAQKQAIKPDLSNKNGFELINRDMTASSNEGKIIVHLNSKPNYGVAWINNLSFERGVIEFDVRGESILQQSFVGIAFHALNDSTFDAVYFRPFNFQSPDTTRGRHSVQYISLPQYDWPVLREKYPGKFENALAGKTDPDSWFHVRCTIDTNNIAVYVNGDKIPSLLVKPLTDRTTGKIGFWVGNNSDGDFSNLIVQNK